MSEALLDPTGQGADFHIPAHLPPPPSLGEGANARPHDGTGTPLIRRNSTFFDRTFSSMDAGSLRGSVLTLMSSALGTGILALPFLLREAGFIPGISFILVCACLAVYSIYILVACGHRTGIKNYSELTTHVFGKRQGHVLEGVIVIYGFGVLIAYLIIIGQSMHQVILSIPGIPDDSILRKQNIVLTIITVCIAFPLSLLRNLTSLRYATIFSVASMLYVAVAVVIRCAQRGSLHDVTYVKFGWDTFSAFTIGLFSYTCHINVFTVYSELHNPLVRRMRKVTRRSVILEVFLYQLVAIAGYLTFPSNADGNILSNYDKDDKLFVVARVAVSTALIVALPLNLNPARKNLEQVLFPDAPFSTVRHVTETSLFLGSALALGMKVPNVSTVFGLLGATCCVYFCYALPTALYVNIFRNEISRTHRWFCIGIAGVVTVIGVTSVGVTVKGWIH